MAQQIQDDNSPKKKKKPLNKTAFLCCFGFSAHRRDNNHHLFSGKKRRILLFSRNQKSAAKTVPLLVDAAAAVAVAADEKVNRSKQIHVVKSDSGSKNRQLPATAGKTPVIVPGEGFHRKTNKAKTESKTLLDHLASKKNISGGPTTVLSRTSSAGKSQKKKKSTAAHGGGVDSEYNIDSTRNQQDFMYGMSILMLILIIMLLWGRICAIFCTAAWLYFVPRIKKNQEKEKALWNNGGVVSNDVVLRFSSVESKQKVVLDGFLERNHRTTIIL